MGKLHRIVPCLWFDHEAEEAASFYVSIFENSRIGRISRYTEAGHEIHGKPEGSVLTVAFTLDGHAFTALNGGPRFKLSEAISLQVMCDTQEEVDYYWSRLTADGGREGPCGWLTDRFGLSWQVVPTLLEDMLTDADPDKVNRVMSAIFEMEKIDIAAVQRAYAGE